MDYLLRVTGIFDCNGEDAVGYFAAECKVGRGRQAHQYPGIIVSDLRAVSLWKGAQQGIDSACSLLIIHHTGWMNR